MDRAALEREMAALHPRSFGWALACCRWDRQEAEDVLQTAYLKLLEGRARFGERATFKTFLFAVIRKTAADRRRRKLVATLGLLRLKARTGAAPDPTVPVHPDVLRIRAALSALAARQREVLDLVFYHDLTIEQAALVMGVSLGAARVHYERGKKRLAERLR
ncbi:MAG TPA: RNA polymerase sigma factor [Polyangia bacterium]|nr:RNA polymerase sigma factor [Polyangia bacterium]